MPAFGTTRSKVVGYIQFFAGCLVMSLPLVLSGCASLHRAASTGDTKNAIQLIESGANVNKTDFLIRETPLHKAARHGHADTAKLLLKHGADVHKGNFVKQTPLHHAARHGHADMVKLLLNHGADVNARSTQIGTQAGTPLHEAASSGHADMAKLLLDHGADVNETDCHGAPAWLLLFRTALSKDLLRWTSEDEEEHRKQKCFQVFKSIRSRIATNASCKAYFINPYGCMSTRITRFNRSAPTLNSMNPQISNSKCRALPLRNGRYVVECWYQSNTSTYGSERSEYPMVLHFVARPGVIYSIDYLIRDNLTLNKSKIHAWIEQYKVPQ